MNDQVVRAKQTRHGDEGRGWLGRRRGDTTATEPESDFDPGQLDLARLLRRKRYAGAQLSLFYSQYVKIRGDLLVSIGDDKPLELGARKRRYAVRCADYLRSAKSELESRRPNFVLCSSLLFLADVTLVWLYPRGILEPRCEAAIARLEQLEERADWLERGLRDSDRHEDDRFARSALEDALNYLHGNEQANLVEDDLQVTRLHSLILYIGAAFLMLIVAVPYVTTRLGEGIEGWPVAEFASDEITQLVSALAVSVIGAVGGIFSGLIATWDSRAKLVEYRTSMLKLALKPLVGAVAALTLYLLLSWQVLTGVEVTNGGTFLLVGFLAGFSERYFLRLLSPREGEVPRVTQPQQSGGALPSQPTQAAPREFGDESPVEYS